MADAMIPQISSTIGEWISLLHVVSWFARGVFKVLLQACFFCSGYWIYDYSNDYRRQLKTSHSRTDWMFPLSLKLRYFLNSRTLILSHKKILWGYDWTLFWWYTLMVYTANWGIICHLPPFTGTKNNHWYTPGKNTIYKRCPPICQSFPQAWPQCMASVVARGLVVGCSWWGCPTRWASTKKGVS